MPQELRAPQFRTRHFSYKASKILQIYNLVSATALIERGMIESVLSRWWPKATKEDLKILDLAIIEIDAMTRQTEIPKQQNTTKGKTILFEEY